MENETHLNLLGSDRSVWIVFTDDSIMIRKFQRLGYRQVKCVGEGFTFEIPDKLITFRKNGKKREMSEEKRLQASERLKAIHDKKRKT